MKWEKKGLIFRAEGQNEYLNSHIQNPYIIDLDDRYRVFFTSRPKPLNSLYKASIVYIDLDKDDLTRIIDIANHPVFDYGKRGTFDEYGMMPGAIFRKNNELWMYYVGWTREVSVPYSWSIGLAISNDDGKNFTRFGNGPIIGKVWNDPYLQNGCSAVVEDMNGRYTMFYSSGVGWLDGENGHPESQYVIRKAKSDDGINWCRGDYPICLKYDDESQTSPTVFKHGGKYHMYFPYRHSVDFRNTERGYRIGYAFSDDLETWIRDDDNVGIGISDEGWDSEMVCYPHVSKLDDKIVMLYCGNGFGVGGMGYAVLKEE